MKRTLAITVTLIVLFSVPSLLLARGGALETITSITAMRSWTVGPSSVITGENCFATEFTFDAALKAWPRAGSLPGTPTTWGTITNNVNNCETYSGLTTDDNAVYYYDSENDFIAKRLFSNPSIEVVVSNVSNSNGFDFGSNGFQDLVLSNDHIFWLGNDGDVWRVAKAGGSAELFVSSVNGINMLETTKAWLFMATDFELRQVDLNCTPLPCSTVNTIDVSLSGFVDVVDVQTATEGPSGSLIGEVHLFYTTNDNEALGRKFAVDSIGDYVCETSFVNFMLVTECETNILYQTSASNLLGKVSYRDGHIYWQEYDAIDGKTYVYALALGAGAPIVIDQANGLFFYGKTEADQSGVYYRTQPGNVKRYTLATPTQVALQHHATEQPQAASAVLAFALIMTAATIVSATHVRKI